MELSARKAAEEAAADGGGTRRDEWASSAITSSVLDERPHARRAARIRFDWRGPRFADEQLEAQWGEEALHTVCSRGRALLVVFAIVIISDLIGDGLRDLRVGLVKGINFVLLLAAFALYWNGEKRFQRLGTASFFVGVVFMSIFLNTVVQRMFMDFRSASWTYPIILAALSVVARLPSAHAFWWGCLACAAFYAASVSYLPPFRSLIMTVPNVAVHYLAFVCGLNIEVTERRLLALQRALRAEAEEVERQKGRSDAVLFNMFPSQVAELLRAGRAAEVNRAFPSAAVVFVEVSAGAGLAAPLGPGPRAGAELPGPPPPFARRAPRAAASPAGLVAAAVPPAPGTARPAWDGAAAPGPAPPSGRPGPSAGAPSPAPAVAAPSSGPFSSLRRLASRVRPFVPVLSLRRAPRRGESGSLLPTARPPAPASGPRPPSGASSRPAGDRSASEDEDEEDGPGLGLREVDRRTAERTLLLNRVVGRLERLCDRHGLQKIKTDGFVFMAACGVPEEQPAPAASLAAARFAADALAFAARRGLRVRVGLHVGPLFAGIIGAKPAYDLWGDTVNTASRVCSACEPDQVLATEALVEAAAQAPADGSPAPLFADAGERELRGRGRLRLFALAAPAAPTSPPLRAGLHRGSDASVLEAGGAGLPGRPEEGPTSPLLDSSAASGPPPPRLDLVPGSRTASARSVLLALAPPFDGSSAASHSLTRAAFLAARARAASADLSGFFTDDSGSDDALEPEAEGALDGDEAAPPPTDRAWASVSWRPRPSPLPPASRDEPAAEPANRSRPASRSSLHLEGRPPPPPPPRPQLSRHNSLDGAPPPREPLQHRFGPVPAALLAHAPSGGRGRAPTRARGSLFAPEAGPRVRVGGEGPPRPPLQRLLASLRWLAWAVRLATPPQDEAMWRERLRTAGGPSGHVALAMLGFVASLVGVEYSALGPAATVQHPSYQTGHFALLPCCLLLFLATSRLPYRFQRARYFLTSLVVCAVAVLDCIVIPRLGIEHRELDFIVSDALVASVFVSGMPAARCSDVLPVLLLVHAMLAIRWKAEIGRYLVSSALVCALSALFSEASARRHHAARDAIRAQTAALESEKGRTAALLGCCMPPRVIRALARATKPGAPFIEFYEQVWVASLDVVSFTRRSSAMKAEEVVEMIDRLFTDFDGVADRFGLQRVKTLGDCYVAAAFPRRHARSPGHEGGQQGSREAAAVVWFAVECARCAAALSPSDGGGPVLLRAGVASGPACGGVIGRRGWFYDVFGPAVDAAHAIGKAIPPGSVAVSAVVEEETRAAFRYQRAPGGGGGGGPGGAFLLVGPQPSAGGGPADAGVIPP